MRNRHYDHGLAWGSEDQGGERVLDLYLVEPKAQRLEQVTAIERNLHCFTDHAGIENVEPYPLSLIFTRPRISDPAIVAAMNKQLPSRARTIWNGIPRFASGACVLTLAFMTFLSAQTVLAGQDYQEPRKSQYPLWGDLSAGPHGVGFRTVFKFDSSRTWHVTRDYKGRFSSDLHGRPIQLNIWYPSDSGSPDKQMTVADYVEQAAPEEFSMLNALMKERSLQNIESDVPSGQLAALRSTRVNACREVLPAAGPFPAVLCVGGLNADINSNFVLAEFLASHGYVVASISLLGQTDQLRSIGRTPSDVETVVRDMEFAWAIISQSENVNRAKLAAIGHSVGAIDAAVFGLRNGNVSAIAGLDGTYGFKGSVEVLTNAYGYAPEKMRAAFLDLRRTQGEQQADLDLSAISSFRYADRSVVTLAKMHHSDFTSFAMIASKFEVPIQTNYVNSGWDRTTGQRGYEHVCRILLAFLDANLSAETAAAGIFREAVKQPDGSSFRHLDAGYAPPSPRECVALAANTGLEEVKSLLTKCAGEMSVGSCVDASLFNTYGYELLGQNRPKDALIIFELTAWAHPVSANAQDSLADAFLAMGEKKPARLAIQKALDLAPSDPSIGVEAKDSFVADEKQRLEQLK